MSRELFLARHLIDKAADPYATPAESDEAASELVAFAMRFQGKERLPGYPVRIEHFERVRPDDLSATGWLLLLENAGPNDPILPTFILDDLFNRAQDEVIRFRLVSATLRHPSIRRSYEELSAERAAVRKLSELPHSWPQHRLMRLDDFADLSTGEEEIGRAEALLEFVLYLLQDGSLPARMLAAAAMMPEEAWRDPARQLARNVIRAVDPELQDYGLPFRQARL